MISLIEHQTLNQTLLVVMAVVKKTHRYSNVFLYNRIYHPSVFRNLFLKSAIDFIPLKPLTHND